MKFKVGDIVRSSYEVSLGLVGVVKHIKPNGGSIGVDFADSGFYGHDLNGNIHTRTGYWIPAEYLVLEQDFTPYVNKLIKYARRCHV